jgi:hypothetical protein
MRAEVGFPELTEIEGLHGKIAGWQQTKSRSIPVGQLAAQNEMVVELMATDGVILAGGVTVWLSNAAPF